MSSIKVQPLTSQNRPGVRQLVFDAHVRAVPAIFNFLKLRPIALVVWTAISTAILKIRQTSIYNYNEVLTILAGSIIVTQGILFLVLLYDASTQAPGSQVVGRLQFFADQDLKDEKKGSSSSRANTNKTGVEKRSAAAAGSKDDGTNNNRSSSSVSKSELVPVTVFNKDNQFWVLEKDGQGAMGCIGATLDLGLGVAKLTIWTVAENARRKGAGTLLLKTAMDDLSKNNKLSKVQVTLQGHQIPALRLFYKLGFLQIDRVPEWMGERVVLEVSTKDWIKKNQQPAK